MTLLEVQGLRKTYPSTGSGRRPSTGSGPRADRVVLHDVSLTVQPHDVICLIGASGSGKSTLLRCLNLLEPIDDGTITFEGREISDPRIDARRVRQRIGMVFQAYNLFPHLSVLANCTLAQTKVHGVSKAAARARALELLDRFGLAGHAEAFPDSLSGGQQQRVALVRALCTQPQLLLLDEITAALDPELVGEVMAIVRAEAAAGTTMVLATHEMAFAREVATTVCFLDGGRIIEQGSPEQLFGAPQQPRTREFLARIV